MVRLDKMDGGIASQLDKTQTSDDRTRPHPHPGFVLLITICLFWGCAPPSPPDIGPRKIEVLFLGHDREHHPSETYAPMLASALAKDGINISYTDDPADLNPETLAHHARRAACDGGLEGRGCLQ